jgi:hypothetical protein
LENYLGFIEFFVVALFALCWGILELVGRRLDKKKEASGLESGRRLKHDGLELNRLAVSVSTAHPGAPEGAGTKSRKKPHAK